MPFSSRGPREDGGFKPNITAPGAAISTADLDLSVYRGTTLVGQSADGDSDESVSLVNLANGESSTISGTVTAVSAPEAGRQLFGELVVVSDQGAVLGRGSVIIGAVG